MTRILSFLLCFSLVACKNNASKDSDISNDTKITSYYFIRHAEKDRTDPENSDPELTEEGKARAERWASYFDSIDLDAVYSTNYIRTQMTASPTANRKQLDVLPYNPRQLYNDEFQQYTNGKKVLVVGHSNTTPAFVNKILGREEYPEMDDSDNSSLFVVSLKNNTPTVEIRSVQ